MYPINKRLTKSDTNKKLSQNRKTILTQPQNEIFGIRSNNYLYMST